MGELLRLDKYLADAGVGTRSQVKQMIRKGQIAINGETVKKPDQKVDGEKDKIEVMGKEIRYQKYRYLLLHKPSGYVSATEDKKEQTVLSLLPEELRKDLFPVGRLDKDTEGLLLLTNDGALAHRLLSPKKHVDKTYYARVQGRVTDEDQAAFLQGVDIGDEKDTMPAQLEILEAAEESRILLTIQEGRFHQVKRMFEARGKKVVYLKRISMGHLALEEGLKPGNYRELTEEEQEALGLKEK
ncbi:rRNA pseudouridine synthase [bacterium]|nr:rRNA pseudouridine synthase [bacterium]MDY3021686.1 pseudouridine synthase [Oliverpabstia sp.]